MPEVYLEIYEYQGRLVNRELARWTDVGKTLVAENLGDGYTGVH